MSESKRKEDLDWENMDEVVPMNLIDSDFAEARIEPEPEGPVANAEETGRLPGAISHILPRETVESLLAPLPEALQAPKRIPSASDTDNFTRLRAEMEAQNAAENAAEQEAKAKQEAEEEAQRQRLEQWMANARARLEKADEKPTAPGRPTPLRREPSPTMVRRVEMQRTIIEPGAPTEENTSANAEPLAPGFEDSSGYRTGKIALDNADPLATIIVHRDTFVESTDSPKTNKLQSLERRVAQIKLSEASAETMIMTRTLEEPKRVNVKLAIWIMAGLIPIILGLGIFALLQTGYLDSLSDLVPGQSSHPSLQTSLPPNTQQVIATTPPKASPVQAKEQGSTVPVTTVSPASNASGASTASAVAAGSEAATVSKPTTTSAPAPAVILKKALSKSTPASVKINRPQPGTVKAEAPPPETVAKTEETAPASGAMDRAMANAEASMNGIEVAKPAFRNETIHSARGEAALKELLKEKLRREAGAIQGVYEAFSKTVPDLNGDIVIGITINPNGHIAEGSIAASTTGAPEFDQEILRKVLGWSLSAFPDNRPRYVAIPFHFEPPAP